MTATIRAAVEGGKRNIVTNTIQIMMEAIVTEATDVITSVIDHPLVEIERSMTKKEAVEIGMIVTKNHPRRNLQSTAIIVMMMKRSSAISTEVVKVTNEASIRMFHSDKRQQKIMAAHPNRWYLWER